MKVNRKNVFLSIAAAGAAGLFAVGAGTAMAATGVPSAPWSASADCDGSGFDGMAGGRYGAMMGGVGAGHMYGGASVHAAVASYLGLSQDELWAQMRSGRSIADIATAQGKSVSGLESAMTAAMTRSLDANTTLTAQQKADLLSRMKDRIGFNGGMMGGQQGGMWN